MSKIQEFRNKHGNAYNDLSDQELADKLHTKFYSDIPKAEFYSKMGVSVNGQPKRTPQQQAQGQAEQILREEKDMGFWRMQPKQSFVEGARQPYNAIRQGASWLGNKVGLVDDAEHENLNSEIKQDKLLYDALTGSEQSNPAMAGNVAGSVAATGPAMLLNAPKVGMLAKGLYNAGQGGVAMGVSTPVTEGDNYLVEKGKQVAGGAAMGVVAAPVVNALVKYGIAKPGSYVFSKVSDAIKKGEQLFNSRGNFTPKTIQILREGGIDPAKIADDVRAELYAQAQQSVKNTPALNAAELTRKANFDKIGVTPTKGNITRDFTQQQFEAETAKLNTKGGQILRSARDRQDDQLHSAYNRFEKGLGGKASDAYDTSKSLGKAINKKSSEMQKEISKVYDDIRDQYKDNPFIDTEKLQQLLADKIKMGEAALVPQLKVLNASLKLMRGKEGKPLTADQSETLRKMLSRYKNESHDGTVKYALGEVMDQLDDDVVNSAGVDVFGQPRALARARFQEFKDNVLNKMLHDGKYVDEEVVKKMVFSKSSGVDDLTQLHKTLTTGTEEQVLVGTQAWNDLRAMVAKQAYQDSIKRARPNSFDVPTWGANQFRDALAKVGDRKLKLLFTKAELQELATIQQVGQDRIALPGAVNFSGTSAAAYNMLDKVVKHIPSKWGRLIQGGFNKAREGADEAAAEVMAREAVEEPMKSIMKDQSKNIKGMRADQVNELLRKNVRKYSPGVASIAGGRLTESLQSN